MGDGDILRKTWAHSLSYGTGSTLAEHLGALKRRGISAFRGLACMFQPVMEAARDDLGGTISSDAFGSVQWQLANWAAQHFGEQYGRECLVEGAPLV